MAKKPKMGEFVRDIVTGFQGYVIGITSYITGCEQYLLQPKVESAEKATTFPEGRWVDWERLEVLGVPPIVLSSQQAPAEKKDTGFDIPAPIR